MASISSLSAILAYAIALCGAVPLFPLLESAPRLIRSAGLVAGLWPELQRPWPP